MSPESPDALREELERTRAELAEARGRVAAMEMSFFWKLRNSWWRVKSALGIADGWAPVPAVGAAPLEAAGHVPGFETVAFRGPDFARFSEAVDVVVLAHEDRPALEASLGSLVRHARPPYSLTIADSRAEPARGFLETFAIAQGAHALHGADAFSRALSSATARTVLVLDGRTRLAEDAVDRLLDALSSDKDAAAVAPVAADVPGAGPAFRDSAPKLPGGAATLFAADSARIFPSLSAGGGSAVLVKRAALPAGAFDSSRGVLDVLRAANRRVLLADDVWAEGAPPSSGGAPDRVLAGLAARASILPERLALRERARERHEGRRVLYVLPVLERGGGSNVVLSEARAMARMGVEARVFNLEAHRGVFEKSYPVPGVTMVWGRESDLVEVARGFDAVVATAHYSVPWMLPLASLAKPPVLGYCIQDYEPLFYAEGSTDFRRAFDSYGLVPGMKRFSKSKWNADEVTRKTGLDCALVSASFDAEVFRPRLPSPPARPVRIAAMVRPSTPRRQPGLTVEAVRAVARKLGDAVEIVVFGCEKNDPALRAFPLDFPHRFVGVLDDKQLATLMSQVHVFADLSTYQALGVASLEAMGSGAAVVVPKAGGADTFARHEVNALTVDTSSVEACAAALERLVMDEALLSRLSSQALVDALSHTPDRAAAGILEVLFGGA